MIIFTAFVVLLFDGLVVFVVAVGLGFLTLWLVAKSWVVFTLVS